jgi:hypothetical protein
MEKERPPVFGTMQRGGKLSFIYWTMCSKRRSSRLSKTPWSQVPWFTLTSTVFMLVLRRGAMIIRASTMAGVSTPEMKRATAFAKCMSTRWKAFGRYCAVGGVRIGAFHK